MNRLAMGSSVALNADIQHGRGLRMTPWVKTVVVLVLVPGGPRVVVVVVVVVVAVVGGVAVAVASYEALRVVYVASNMCDALFAAY